MLEAEAAPPRLDLTCARSESAEAAGREPGPHGSFDAGATGLALLAAGLVGAVTSGVVMYVARLDERDRVADLDSYAS